MNDKEKQDIQINIFEMVQFISNNEIEINEFQIDLRLVTSSDETYGYRVKMFNEDKHFTFNTSTDGIWGLPETNIIYPNDYENLIKIIHDRLKSNLRDYKINNILYDRKSN